MKIDMNLFDEMPLCAGRRLFPLSRRFLASNPTSMMVRRPSPWPDLRKPADR